MDRLVLSAVAGFVLVVGAMTLVWFLRRRSVSQIDDPSILLAAPPEGMTPAVATVIEHAPVRRAFIAGMIDLASRGEITFVDEGGLETGIAIGGADVKDPRIENNRRRPAGEAETWLLGQLQLRAGSPSEAPWNTKFDGANEPFLARTGEAMLASILREESESPDAEMSAVAKHIRQQGLLSTAKLDPELIERAYEEKTGHAMPEEAKERWAEMIAKAPELQAVGTTVGTTDTTTEPSTQRLYITAKQASTLNTPLMFGTFLETYSRRHGWLDSMPVLTRLRWRIAGVVVAAVGVVFLVIGSNSFSDTWTGLGTGLFLGGVVVIWRAPSMVQPSKAGGLVRAQLAAYRRTLDMTFKQAGSINDAVGPAGLPWLTTPDEAIAWAVALGLSDDVINVLARSSATTEAPVSLGRLLHRSAKSDAQPAGPASPVQMFEGIQNIGMAMEDVPNALRPMRQWLNS